MKSLNAQGESDGKRIEVHESLNELLSVIAHATEAEQVYIVFETPDSGLSILAASDLKELPRGRAYEPGPDDVAVAVPYRGKVLGSLMVGGAPSPPDPHLLEGFAAAAGFIMGNLRETGASSLSAKRSQALRQIALEIAHKNEIQRLDSIIKVLRPLVNADYAAAATIEADGTTHWVATDGMKTDTHRHVVFPPGKGMAARTMALGGPIVVEDIASSEIIPATELAIQSGEGGVSVLSAPLITRGVAFGALILGSRSHRKWTAEDIEFTMSLANQVATTIEQSRIISVEKAQRSFLEKVVENFPGIILVLSPPDYRIILASAKFMLRLEESKRAPEFVIGRTLRELMASTPGEASISEEASNLLDALDNIFARVLSTGQSLSFEQFETRSAMPSAATYWNWSVVPVDEMSDDGRRMLLVIALEATETVMARQEAQKAAEEAFKRAEELEAIITQMADAVIIIDKERRVLRANPSALKMFGRDSQLPYDPEHVSEVYNLHTMDGKLFPMENLPSTRALQGENVMGEQMVLKRPEGDEIISASATPLRDASGEITGAVGVFRGISDLMAARLRIEQAANEATVRAEELEAVINHMADGVLIFNASGAIVKSNPAFERLAGRPVLYESDPRVYVRMHGLGSLTGAEVVPEQLPSRRALRGETVLGEQLMLKREGVEEIIVSVSASPVIGSAGEILGAVLVLHDITREKTVERLKDGFLSIVSHELRTPLTAVLGYTDLMIRGTHGSLTDKQARSLRAVRANAERLLYLINDVLDFSKLESGMIELHSAPVDVADMVSKLLAETRVLAADAGVTIHNHITQRVLPSVMADESKLYQIMQNLLSNAIKFTPADGEVTLDAGVSSLSAQDPAIENGPAKHSSKPGVEPVSIIISVADTGLGLEKAQLTRIWDKFYQVDATAKRRSGGTGLGLAIVKSLVELHGGLVWAKSDGPNTGSKFSFSLPLSPARFGYSPDDQEKSSRRIGEVSAAFASEQMYKGTVLVVEDDADQQAIMSDLLRTEGYNVILAEDGEQALQLAASHQPAAIILDVILPRADGWEVLDRLKHDPSTAAIPVMVVSVLDQPAFGKKLGAQEYMIKPLKVQALRATINRMVSGV